MNRSFFGLPGGAGNTDVSCVHVAMSNGFGTISTKHRRFLQVVLNIGTEIIYDDSVSYGASFRLASAGRYAMTYVDSGNAAENIGISLNSLLGTTSVQSIPATERVANSVSANVNYIISAAVTRWFPAGSIIRPHSDGLPVGTDNTMFVITKL